LAEGVFLDFYGEEFCEDSGEVFDSLTPFASTGRKNEHIKKAHRGGVL